MYVTKFRGAGQGEKALVAEVIAGELARALGLPSPELVVVDVDVALAAAEPDPEIQELIQASPGANLGIDFLPGSLAFTDGTPIDPDLAAEIVWLDTLITNVDRTHATRTSSSGTGALAHRSRRRVLSPARPDLARAHRARAGADARRARPAVGRRVDRGGRRRLASRAISAVGEAAARVPAQWLGVNPATRRADLAAFLWSDSGVRAASSPTSRKLVPDASFAYALLRVVPDIERGEQLNAGVVVYCRRRDFLELRTQLDEQRIGALAPQLDVTQLGASLEALRAIACGEPAGGALAELPASERFGWLVAPASTIIQPSEVHTGLTPDPAATLDRLFATLVRPNG